MFIGDCPCFDQKEVKRDLTTLLVNPPSPKGEPKNNHGFGNDIAGGIIQKKPGD
jgi:hypothetical protein